jgi:probable phosphoglycerate mutase
VAGYLGQARVEPLAMEWDYGEWNGLTRAQIQERIPGWNIWTGPVPGGESLDEVAGRARAVLAGLEGVEGDVAIFAHGHFLRILTTQFLGLAPGMAKHFALATASAGILGDDNGFPAIVGWNIRA